MQSEASGREIQRPSDKPPKGLVVHGDIVGSNVSLSVPDSAPVSTEDFNALLELAEELQKQYERTTSSRLWWRTGLLCATALACVAVYSAYNGASYNWLPGSIAAVSGILIGALCRATLYAQERFRRDQRALEEVVDLLREVEGPFARSGNWTALERARFRIRLSRFGIGGRAARQGVAW